MELAEFVVPFAMLAIILVMSTATCALRNDQLEKEFTSSHAAYKAYYEVHPGGSPEKLKRRVARAILVSHWVVIAVGLTLFGGVLFVQHVSREGLVAEQVSGLAVMTFALVTVISMLWVIVASCRGVVPLCGRYGPNLDNVHIMKLAPVEPR